MENKSAAGFFACARARIYSLVRRAVEMFPLNWASRPRYDQIKFAYPFDLRPCTKPFSPSGQTVCVCTERVLECPSKSLLSLFLHLYSLFFAFLSWKCTSFCTVRPQYLAHIAKLCARLFWHCPVQRLFFCPLSRECARVPLLFGHHHQRMGEEKLFIWRVF